MKNQRFIILFLSGKGIEWSLEGKLMLMFNCRLIRPLVGIIVLFSMCRKLGKRMAGFIYRIMAVSLGLWCFIVPSIPLPLIPKLMESSFRSEEISSEYHTRQITLCTTWVPIKTKSILTMMKHSLLTSQKMRKKNRKSFRKSYQRKMRIKSQRMRIISKLAHLHHSISIRKIF